VVRHTANQIILTAAPGSDFGDWIADTLHLNLNKNIIKISVVNNSFPFGITESCLKLTRIPDELLFEKIDGGCNILQGLLNGYHKIKYVDNHLIALASFPPDTSLPGYSWSENFSYEIDYYPLSEYDINRLQIWNQSYLPFKLSNAFFNSTMVTGSSILGGVQTRAVKSIMLQGDFSFMPNYKLEYTFEYVKDSKNRISKAYVYSKSNITAGDRRLSEIKAFVYEEE
jgi:hypothetical protein